MKECNEEEKFPRLHHPGEGAEGISQISPQPPLLRCNDTFRRGLCTYQQVACASRTHSRKLVAHRDARTRGGRVSRGVQGPLFTHVAENSICYCSRGILGE